MGGELLYRGVSGHSHLSGTHLSHAFGKGSLERIKSEFLPTGADAPEIDRAITIGKPAEELYRLWTDPKTLSRIVPDMIEVTDQGQGRKHWAAHGPNGRRIGWNTRVVDDKPGKLVRWRSEEGAAIPNKGVVRFSPAPGDWGTEVRLHCASIRRRGCSAASWRGCWQLARLYWRRKCCATSRALPRLGKFRLRGPNRPPVRTRIEEIGR